MPEAFKLVSSKEEMIKKAIQLLSQKTEGKSIVVNSSENTAKNLMTLLKRTH